ncbi:two-component regulator propeller domain-containing protein [Shewanella sp. UCD-KL12]|uniref:sensor histidine kinase n=1 Tax=Shewanella sp. UCD-KL12 TaxID=1917163 RepID=UPI002116C5A8|nr:two-component regulator propeller domain-containing protein [Shewanella sp. UCD-KL12]
MIWFIVFPASVMANQPRFDLFTAEQGLSMNTVTDIATDHQGYLWVSTQTGLNRFDGKEFKQYLYTGNNKGPSESYINKLFYGRSNQLWLLTRSEGINLYDPLSDSFQYYNHTNSPLPDTVFTDISQDKQGNLWLATENEGLIHFSPSENKILQHYRQDSGTNHLDNEQISQLFVDRFDRLWFISQAGLSLITAKQELKHFTQLNLQISDPITSLEIGQSNTLWIGTKSKGLFLFDIYTGSLKPISTLSSLKERKITNLQKDRFGKLWIGIEGVGLAKYSPQHNDITFYPGSSENHYGLKSPMVTAIDLDDEHQLWVGTQGGGLSRIYLDAEGFGHIHPFSFSKNNLNNANVRTIFIDRYRQLWIGTSLGLYLAEMDEHKQITGFSLFEVKGSKLNQSFITFINEDREGKFWIGTRNEGLFIFSADKQSYINYKHNAEDKNGLPSDQLISIYFDADDNAWITTKNAGVTRYISEQKGFTHYQHDKNNPNTISSNNIRNIIQDREGNFWLASYNGGLNRLSPDGTFTHFSTDTKHKLPSKHLLALFEGENDTLWIGSTDGVFSFNTKTFESQNFNTNNGLIGNAVYLSIMDNKQNLWIGTATGLSVLNTQNLNIKNYTYIDGLQDNEFNFGAGFVDKDNRIFLGGVNGFNYFYSSQLPKQSPPRKPVISHIEVLNSDKSSSAKQLQTSISQAKHITLSHRDNIFTLSFHSPELHKASRLVYEYKVVGLNDNWITASANQKANFTGLPSGAYIFMLRARGISGQYSAIKQLAIKLLPAPWLSWWAYSIYTLTVLLLLLLFFYTRWKKFNQLALLLGEKQASEERLQLSLWGSGDEFWDWDVKAKSVIRTNTFLCYPEGETDLNKVMQLNIHPDDLPNIKPKIKSCIDNNDDKFEIVYRGKQLDGNWLWVINRGQVINRDEQGNATRIAGTIKNIQSLKEAETALITLNQELEQRVLDRTEQYKQSNDELKVALEQLEFTQGELVNKEKMATLGGLVASITHEINTPIGISVTAASHLQESVKVFNSKYSEGEVSHEDFEQYQNEVFECASLVQTNLNRASKLIKSFKQVSVDQSHEDIHQFNLKQYIDEIFLSLNPLLSRTPHEYSYSCPDDLVINSTPGIFYQIISNLFNNSVIHAFPDGSSGKLTLNIIKVKSGLEIVYQDNGCGMDDSVQEQVFAPFFTTKRGKGGSGLGMNIVFNLVTQELQGEVRLHSEIGRGTTFNISLPSSLLVENSTS